MSDAGRVTDVASRNVAAVRRMYEAERRRDLDTWVSLWHPDGRQTFPFGGADPVIGLDAMTASTSHKFATRGAVTIDDAVEAFADPRKVFARTHVSIEFTELGRTLQAELWCLFHFDDAGLIVEHQEVLDTASAARVLD